jgi:hypothetical protein
LAVALTVTFTVCDAQQIGLSPSGDLLLMTLRPVSFQTNRPVQKTPSDLGPLRLSNEGLASRSQFAGSSRNPNDSKGFQYSLVVPICWAKPFFLRLNSCESPRAPPPMDPPTFC